LSACRLLIPPPSARFRPTSDEAVMILPRRSRRTRHNRAVVLALYINAGLLAALVVTMLARDGRGSISLLPAAHGAEGPAMGGGGNLYLIPGQFSESTYGCYVMDTDAQTLCVYKFDGRATTLKLIAARNFRHDRRLGHLNTLPDPKEVEVMVEAERAGGRRTRGGPDDGGAEPPGPGGDTAPSGPTKSRGIQD
jgi:hypothetical protein